MMISIIDLSSDRMMDLSSDRMTYIIKIKKIYCHRLKHSENGQPAAISHSDQ
jgi:hypothetical protein